MAGRSLTVVIPALNAEAFVGGTLTAFGRAAAEAPALDVDIVLVDDGSTDGTADAAEAAAQAAGLPLRVIRQPNRGRFEARRAGIDAVAGDWTLLLDSRVTLAPGSLRFLAERLDAGEDVWNGHVEIDDGGNPLATFWQLLAALAWSDYFDDPRTTSFDWREFDRYPSGTTCFVAPTAVLREALASFRTRYADVRRANDDTPLLRSIARTHRIHISPSFACTYAPRTSVTAFARHSVHRGVVFLDGHGRRESRLFGAVVAFYPVSAVAAVAVLRRPRRAVGIVAAVSAAAAALGVAKRRTPCEVGVLATVTPLYAAGHALGMWKGLGYLLARRAAT